MSTTCCGTARRARSATAEWRDHAEVKVLALIDSLITGGAEQSLVDMAPYLVAAGVDLEVATLHDRPGLQDELAAAGVPLTCLAGGGGRAGWVARATRLVRRHRPDLVHTTLFEADVVGRVASTLTGTPVVTSLVNVAYGPEQRATPGITATSLRAAQALDLVTATRAVRFQALSTLVADVMARRLRIPRSRIDVIPRGRNPMLLGTRTVERRIGARRALEVPDGAKLVVALARQEHQKGLDVLIDALPILLSRHPNVHVLLGGRPGNQTPLLHGKVENLGLASTARFIGIRRDVGDVLAAADVFVLPSRWEGLGSVLLEAMALEAPIVASDLPPVREVVDDHARLVAAGSPDRLAATLAATLNDPLSAAEQARHARKRFLELFTTERVSHQMAAFYQRALRAD